MKVSYWTICLGLVSGALGTSSLKQTKENVEEVLQQVCDNDTVLGDKTDEFAAASKAYLDAAKIEVDEFVDARTYNVSNVLTTFSLLNDIKTQVDNCKHRSFIEGSGKELSENLNELIERFKAEVYKTLLSRTRKVKRLKPKVEGSYHSYLKSLPKYKFHLNDLELLRILTTANLRNSLKEAVDNALPIVEQNLEILRDMQPGVESAKTTWLRRPDLALQAEYTAAMTNLMDFKQYLERFKSLLGIGTELPGGETQVQETDSTTGSSSEETSSSGTETSSSDTETSSSDTETSSGDTETSSGDDNQLKKPTPPVTDHKTTPVIGFTPPNVPTSKGENSSETTSKDEDSSKTTSESDKPGNTPGVVPISVKENITPVIGVGPTIVPTGEDESSSETTSESKKPGNTPGVVPIPVKEGTTSVIGSEDTSEDKNPEPSLLKRHKTTIIVAGICIIVAVGGVVVYYLLDGSQVPS